MIIIDRSQPAPNAGGWRWDAYRQARDYALGVYRFDREVKESRQLLVRVMLGEGMVQ